MKYLPIPFFTALIFCAQMVHAQPNWREVVQPAFLRLIEEANDSIAKRKTEANIVRGKMNEIITEKKLDRIFIAGENDKYMAEGMHRFFTSAPGPVQGHYERDKRIVELENLHVDLYYSDQALFRWQEMLKKIRAHPDMGIHSRWARDWNALPVGSRPNSLEECRKWVTDKLVCDVTTTTTVSLIPPQTPTVGSFDPAFTKGVLPVAPASYQAPKLTFPIPTEMIVASYPMNGQFAFHRSESIPGVGYVAFAKTVQEQFYQIQEKNVLKARWTSAKGAVVYTLAEFRFQNGNVFFNFPKALEPDMVYRLELVALPATNRPETPSVDDCWRMFRGKPVAETTISDLPVPGEIKITELFFRSGKYAIFEKPKTMAGVVDWTSGSIQFRTDEPLDEIEMYGFGKVPPLVTFALQTAPFYQVLDALKSKSVVYYLTVPRVEPLENVPADQLVAAELDHTLDAPFIRKVALGNADSYIHLPDSPQKDIALRGNYILPLLQNARVKDSLVTAQPVPFITSEHFKKKKSMPFPPTKCTLYIGELQQLVAAAAIQQEQLRRRVRERAQFFYELEKRRALREGKPFTATLEAFMQQEQENLPAEVKTILETAFPDVFKKEFTVLISRRFPGTDQYSASLSLQPEVKQ